MGSRDRTEQRWARPNLLVNIPLVAMLAATGILLVFEVRNGKSEPVFAGTPTTAAIFSATLGALLARFQYAGTVRPILRYESQWVDLTEHRLTGPEPFREVRIQNVGPGAAVLTRIQWVLRGAATPDVEETFATIDELRRAFDRRHLVEGQDYFLENLSPGTALPHGDDQLYFECSKTTVDTFAALTVMLEFKSLVGDHFRKPVSLLPRPGASAAVVVTGRGQ